MTFFFRIQTVCLLPRHPLFLDNSKCSLKCVLLHIGNVYGAVPVGQSAYLREDYDDMRMVMDLLKYHEHNWVMCVDLKMVDFLLGQQRVFTKCPCFLCMLDSRAPELGERFHQDLKGMEECYQGHWDQHMMEHQTRVYKRKSYKRKFLPQ